MSDLEGLRIAIVTPTLARVGGTEVYLENLFRAHRALGIRAAAFVPGAGEARDHDGVPVTYHGGTISESASPDKVLRRMPRVSALSEELAQFDLVEFHRIAPLDLVEKLEGRVPVALYVHTSELTCPSGGRYLPRSGRLCDADPGFHCFRSHAVEGCLATGDGVPFPPKQRLRAMVRGWMSRRLAQSATAFVHASDSNRRLFARHIVEPNLSFVLPPPLSHTETGEDGRDPGRLLFVGRLVASKGVLDAVRVAGLLKGTELHICGTGPAEEEARRIAREVGATVHFHGWVGREDVQEQIRRAGCVLAPSRGFESWATVAAESVAQCRPVAAWDFEGIHEWLPATGGGVAPLGDVEALAKVADGWRHRRVPEEDAQALWNEYGPDAIAAKYADITRAILRAGPGDSFGGDAPG